MAFLVIVLAVLVIASAIIIWRLIHAYLDLEEQYAEMVDKHNEMVQKIFVEEALEDVDFWPQNGSIKREGGRDSKDRGKERDQEIHHS